MGCSFASASTDAMHFYDEIMVPRLFEPWGPTTARHVAASNWSGRPRRRLWSRRGVARQAARRVGASGRVTGCDLSPAMLDLARAKVPVDASAPINYLECSADLLDVPDDAVDLVTCQQGLQFFPDRAAALSEMRRSCVRGDDWGLPCGVTLRTVPHGRPFATALGQVVGDETRDAFKAGPWGFDDPATLVRLISESGFTEVKVHRCELPVVFEGGPGQLLLTLHATAVANAVAQLSAADFAALTDAVAEVTRRSSLTESFVHTRRRTSSLLAEVLEIDLKAIVRTGSVHGRCG